MAMECHFINGEIVEIDVLPDKRRDILVTHVIRACMGEIDMDYEMSGEWVQVKPRTFVNRELYDDYMSNKPNVTVRDFKSKQGITPPQAIIRLRKKNNNAVKRSCEELFRHGWITSYTIRPNGHIHVNWFKGYVRIERSYDTGHGCWKTLCEVDDVIPIESARNQAEYLRDRISWVSNDYIKNLEDVA
jgi:hypothetical protein